MALVKNQQQQNQDSVVAFQEEITFSRLKYFLDSYFVKGNTQQEYTTEESRDILYFPNNKSFKKECLNRSNKKICVLGLLDGRHKRESIKSFERHIKTMEQVANKRLGNHYEFAWVNATCQTGFADHFNSGPDSLPGMVAILPQVKKYTILYGSFEADNIRIFCRSCFKWESTIG